MENRNSIALSFNSFEPVQGADEVIPIIFLHGVTGSKENWGDIPQIVANASGRNTYALDARNHGDSEWSDVFDFQINVDDLLFFMETMYIPKAILVGHSMGGMTAIKTALKVPEKVQQVIVEDMTVGKPNQSSLNNTILYLKLAQEAISALSSGLSLEEAKHCIHDYIYCKIPHDKKSFAKVRFSDGGSLNLKQSSCGRYTYKNNINLLLEKLKDINSMFAPNVGIYEGPACFIFGGKSPFLVGQDELLIRKFFPRAKMSCIEDASHFVHQQYALQFTEELLTFLQGGWNKIKR